MRYDGAVLGFMRIRYRWGMGWHMLPVFDGTGFTHTGIVKSCEARVNAVPLRDL